jgi:hypothetical protein
MASISTRELRRRCCEASFEKGSPLPPSSPPPPPAAADAPPPAEPRPSRAEAAAAAAGLKAPLPTSRQVFSKACTASFSTLPLMVLTGRLVPEELGRTRIDHSFLTMRLSIVASSRRSDSFSSASAAAAPSAAFA